MTDFLRQLTLEEIDPIGSGHFEDGRFPNGVGEVQTVIS